MANNIGSFELLRSRDGSDSRTRSEARQDAAIERDLSIAKRNKNAAKRDKAAAEWNSAAAKREEAQTALIEAVTARIAQGGDLDKGIIEALKAALHGRRR